MGVGVRVIELPNGKIETVMDLDSLYELIREYMGNDVVEFVKDSMDEDCFDLLNNTLNELYDVSDILEEKTDGENKDDVCVKAYDKINKVITHIANVL